MAARGKNDKVPQIAQNFINNFNILQHSGDSAGNRGWDFIPIIREIRRRQEASYAKGL
jgi:hypothetical protein